MRYLDKHDYQLHDQWSEKLHVRSSAPYVKVDLDRKFESRSERMVR